MGQRPSNLPDPVTQEFDCHQFLLAVKENDQPKMKWCLQCKNGDINATNKRGNTALHIAAIHGRHEVIKILIENGAKVNARSRHGYTPLYNAVMQNHPEIVKMLLEFGANKDYAPDVGKTNCKPIEIARIQGHMDMVEMLEDKPVAGAAAAAAATPTSAAAAATAAGV